MMVNEYMKRMDTLASTLKANGLAPSDSEARRMAESMIGTEVQVQKAFSEKKKQNTFGFRMQEHSSAPAVPAQEKEAITTPSEEGPQEPFQNTLAVPDVHTPISGDDPLAFNIEDEILKPTPQRNPQQEGTVEEPAQDENAMAASQQSPSFSEVAQEVQKAPEQQENTVDLGSIFKFD